MLQVKVQSNHETPINKNTKDTLKNIKHSINRSKVSNMEFDISDLNIIDATKVATLGSTYHYLKFNDGYINWIVNSKEVEKILRPLNLGNSRFCYC